MLHVWNIYQHLPPKSPRYVVKYTIHGAYGLSIFDSPSSKNNNRFDSSSSPGRWWKENRLRRSPQVRGHRAPRSPCHHDHDYGTTIDLTCNSLGNLGELDKTMNDWLVVWTPLKNISQLGWFFPIYGKIKNVPNHQPDIIYGILNATLRNLFPLPGIVVRKCGHQSEEELARFLGAKGIFDS